MRTTRTAKLATAIASAALAACLALLGVARADGTRSYGEAGKVECGDGISMDTTLEGSGCIPCQRQGNATHYVEYGKGGFKTSQLDCGYGLEMGYWALRWNPRTGGWFVVCSIDGTPIINYCVQCGTIEVQADQAQ